MKSESEKLLNDLLEDAAPAEFRAELLEQTLARVRRRKRNSGIGRAALVFAVAGLAVAFWSQHAARVRNLSPAAGVVAMIDSTPSRMIMNVQTSKGVVPVIRSTAAGFAIVRSNPARPSYESLTDSELLALTPGQAGVLVRPGLAEAELLVPDPATQLVSVAGAPDENESERAQ